VLPRVLLYERDPLLAKILVDVFTLEQVDVVECGSFADIDQALTEHAGAVVVTDPWTDSREVRLSEAVRLNLNQLMLRTPVVVTTTGWWARKASELDLIPGVKVISKPYDLDELIDAVRAADASVQLQWVQAGQRG
jgi:DNA-binding NtrC family response regulator